MNFEETIKEVVREVIREELHQYLSRQPGNFSTNESKSDSVNGDIEWVMNETGVARQTVYGWVTRKLIPCYKKGGKLIFNKQEIFDWIKKGKQLSVAELESQALMGLSR